MVEDRRTMLHANVTEYRRWNLLFVELIKGKINDVDSLDEIVDSLLFGETKSCLLILRVCAFKHLIYHTNSRLFLLF